MNGAQCSCRCIGPVARRSRGVRRGRKVAWPTRSGDNGKNRFQADRQLLRYRLSCSLALPLASLYLSPFCPPLIPLPRVFVIGPRFVSPFRPSTLLSAETTSGRPASPPLPRLVSSRTFSLLRTPVSQTLAKPRRRQRLSCRSTRPLRFHRDGSGSFFAVIFIVSRSLSRAHCLRRIFHFDF